MDINKKNEEKKLRLLVLPCSEQIPNEKEDEYEKAYQLWHNVWSKTLLKLDGVKHLHSNEFTRHDFVSVIFREDEAIGLFCFSSVNLTLSIRRNDSWFSAWPKEIIADFAENCRNGLIPAWFAVHPEFRRSKSNYPINIAQVTTEIYARTILENGHEMGFGTTRNERGVNQLVQNSGGVKLASANDHGVDVDLVLMLPSNIEKVKDNFSQTSKTLWDNREDYSEIYRESKIKKAA